MAVELLGYGFNESAAVTTTKTLAEGDCGVAQNVTATTTVTLPATVVGYSFVVRVGDYGLTVTIAPNASDKIMGNGFTSADNKAMVFTNQPAGSYVRLVGDGVNGYMVQGISGTATRAA